MKLSERVSLFFPFINELNESSRNKLDDNASILSAKSGVGLLSQGRPVQGAYLVLSGQVEVYIISEEGREKTLYSLGAGEACLFALNAFISKIACPAWARATSPEVEVLYIPGDLFRELYEVEPSLRDWAFQVQSRGLFDLLSTMEEAFTFSVEQRLRSYLVRAADSERKVIATHDSIASYLGTAREVVTRHLKHLTEQGLISSSRGSLVILDMEGMSTVA